MDSVVEARNATVTVKMNSSMYSFDCVVELTDDNYTATGSLVVVVLKWMCLCLFLPFCVFGIRSKVSVVVSSRPNLHVLSDENALDHHYTVPVSW